MKMTKKAGNIVYEEDGKQIHSLSLMLSFDFHYFTPDLTLQ